MNHKTLLIIILIIATLLSGCTTKTNTYTHENNPAEYLELYGDHQYVVVQDVGFCGTWHIHNNALHLYFNDALLYTLQPNGSAYIDPDGDRWIRT